MDLADHAAALSAALARGESVPAGRLMGLPELPEGDVWCDIAGCVCAFGSTGPDNYRLAEPQGTENNPFPQPNRILYRLYWPSKAVREWRD